MPGTKIIPLPDLTRRDARGPGDILRASVQLFLVSSVHAIDSFARRSDAEVAGILDDEGRQRTTTAAVTVSRPIDEVYEFLQDLRNFPRFMSRLDSVETRGIGRWRWRMRLLGRALDWDVELVEDRPRKRLVWRAMAGAIENHGVIRLQPAPGERGTEVHLDIRYSAPMRGIGVLLATMFAVAPDQLAHDDLRRLAQLLEVGEIVHSDASIHRFKHPAQPPRDRLVGYPEIEEKP